MQKPAKCFQVIFHILDVTLGTSLPLYHHTHTHNYSTWVESRHIRTITVSRMSTLGVRATSGETGCHVVSM